MVSEFINQITELFSGDALTTRILFTIIVIVAFLIMIGIIKSILDHIAGDRLQVHYRKAVFRILQIVGGIVVLFIILGIWGINMTALFAGAGFMGIVVGLAAQETLGNVISGLLMMFSRPFEIGDWIEVSGYSGIVQDISVMQTRLKTFDGEMVSIPNSLISSTEVNDKSRNGRLRIKHTIGIDYEADPAEAKRIAEEVMNEHELTMEDPAPKAMIDELGNSSVNVVLLFWIENPVPSKRRKSLHDIITETKRRFEEVGIGIPFPHRELIQHEDKGWNLRKEE
ncbi:MAG: mechanosensitive ion channel family protein [Candidatus Hadarchaeia archaeon]